LREPRGTRHSLLPGHQLHRAKTPPPQDAVDDVTALQVASTPRYCRNDGSVFVESALPIPKVPTVADVHLVRPHSKTQVLPLDLRDFLDVWFWPAVCTLGLTWSSVY